MIDFDSELDTQGTTRIVRTAETAPAVRQSVAVTSDAAGYLAKPEKEWGWSDLRDYLFHEMEKIHGPQVRDPRKESSICKSFISRYGAEQAIAIARYGFETCNGWWKNAPITIYRFCKNSDRYFSDIIVTRL